MHFDIFSAVILLLFAAVIIAALFRQIRLPVILGYLVVGVLLGPHVLGLMTEDREVSQLAEFGVVFLLFTIGLEFSLPRLMAMRTTVFGYGGLQVIISVIVTTLIGIYLGLTPSAAIVVGGVVAMSSTAIVMKQLYDEFQINTTHGNNALGVLLFQDLAVIPFLILIPHLAKAVDQNVAMVSLTALLKGIVAIFVIIQIGRWFLRPLFRRIAMMQSSELFTLTTLFVALSAAWLTNFLGLSLSLGAFLAGMMLGETEFRHQINVEIRPFRDVLLGLFFITVGMQLNLSIIPFAWPWVLLLLSALILFKTGLIMGLGLLFRHSKIDSMRTGLVLAQGGEFSFAILVLALNSRLLPNDYGQVVLAALLLSMALAPMIIRFNSTITRLILPVASRRYDESMKQGVAIKAAKLRKHAIICGYGRVGQHVCRLVQEQSLPYIALDLDTKRVQAARISGENVTFGNAASTDIMLAANITQARAVVICINSHESTLKIAEQVRHLNPDIPIIVRVHDDTDFDDLQKMGVTDAIPETLELSLILGSRLLLSMGMSAVKVFKLEEKVRQNHYQLLREVFPGHGVFQPEEEKVPLQLRAVPIPEQAFAVGKSLSKLQLSQCSVELIAIRREGISLASLHKNTHIKAQDVVVIFGKPEDLERGEGLLLQGKAENITL